MSDHHSGAADAPERGPGPDAQGYGDPPAGSPGESGVRQAVGGHGGMHDAAARSQAAGGSHGQGPAWAPPDSHYPHQGPGYGPGAMPPLHGYAPYGYPPPPGYGFGAPHPGYYTSSQYAPPHAMPNPYQGYAHGVAQDHGHGHGARISDLMDEVANGGNGLSTLSRMLNFDDPDFWKGALVGAAAVLLLTSESVQQALFRSGGVAQGHGGAESDT